MKWFVLLLVAFIFSSLSSLFLDFISKNRHKKIYRTGGAAIILSFLITFLFFSGVTMTMDLMAISIGSFAVLFFGLWDDIKNLNWKKQIFFQIFLVLVLILFGYEIELISFSGKELLRFDFWQLQIFGFCFSIISSILIAIWLIVIINAVNWLDGSDGLLSISSILSLLAVFFVSLRPEVNQPALAIISIIAIGSFAGFLVFNFPPAKIEAGTSGSYFAGFLIASLAIMAGTKISTTMIILILPVTDFIWVIIERLKEGRSIFKRDNKKRHLHYKLLNLGFSSRQILIGYSLFLGLALFLSFCIVSQTQKIILLGVEFIMILVFVISLSINFNIKKAMLKIQKKAFNPIWILALIIVVSILIGFYMKQSDLEDFKSDKKIIINKELSLNVKISQTPEETHRGLSGFEKMPANSGMLFLYNQKSSCSHVMRGMKFGLDFVFLEDGKVVFVESQVPFDSKEVIESPVNCNQVLELNFGAVEKNGIKLGDEMEIN